MSANHMVKKSINVMVSELERRLVEKLFCPSMTSLLLILSAIDELSASVKDSLLPSS